MDSSSEVAEAVFSVISGSVFVVRSVAVFAVISVTVFAVSSVVVFAGSSVPESVCAVEAFDSEFSMSSFVDVEGEAGKSTTRDHDKGHERAR